MVGKNILVWVFISVIIDKVNWKRQWKRLWKGKVALIGILFMKIMEIRRKGS